jgi:class 3 adenylate cyclase
MAEESNNFLARESELRVEVNRLDSELRLERERNAPIEEEVFEAIVGFVDMVDSTRQVIANPASSPDESNEFIRLVLRHLALKLGSVATVCGFTGDGLQFYLKQPSAGVSYRHVMRILSQLPESVKSLCEEDESVRSIVRKVRAEPPRLRTALAFGRVYCGRVVTNSDLIGLPAVEASRLCAEKHSYAENATDLLITHQAYDRGAEWLYWQATDFVPATSVQFSGLEGQEVRLYKPR